MKRPEQAVILCGGLGTRLRPYTDHLPKPMIPCNGKPFLEYLLEQLAEKGIRRFLLLTGYLGEQIQQYFGNGTQQGWEIDYSHGPAEWDTGRRLWEAQDQMDARYLLLYSDNFVPFPLEKVLLQHERHGLPLTFMVSPKNPGNLVLDEEGIVQRYDNQRGEDRPYVEIGYMVVERDRVLPWLPKPDCSFSEALRDMGSQQQISAWVQLDAYHSISDPDRWKAAERYLQPKKILLLDRDGVINEKAAKGEYVNCWEEFRWIERTRDSLRQLSKMGFCFIVISNQAGIARGMTSPEEVERIHRKMVETLAAEGIEILQVYVCPHHWEDNCDCRKPKPGMLFQASRDHLFRLDRTVFVGDDPRDMEAAEQAGCRGVLWEDSPKFIDWHKLVSDPPKTQQF